MTRSEAIKYLKQLYPNDGHCWLDEQRIEAIGMAIDGLTEGYVQHPWSIIRIIEGAIAGDTDKVKRYSRRLADTYIKDEDQKFADCILSAIGEKEVAMATMDDDQCTNEGIEELAKFIRGHLAEIPENAQKEFERIYTKTTGKKMYGGFKD